MLASPDQQISLTDPDSRRRRSSLPDSVCDLPERYPGNTRILDGPSLPDSALQLHFNRVKSSQLSAGAGELKHCGRHALPLALAGTGWFVVMACHGMTRALQISLVNL